VPRGKRIHTSRATVVTFNRPWDASDRSSRCDPARPSFELNLLRNALASRRLSERGAGALGQRLLPLLPSELHALVGTREITRQATQDHMTLEIIGKMAARANVKTVVLSHLSPRADGNYMPWVSPAKCSPQKT
jgi:hypothetical protein